MRPNLSTTIFRTGSNMITVQSTRGAWIDGRWVDGDAEVRNLRAAVRPISPSQREILPEGVSISDGITVLIRGSDRLYHEQTPQTGGREPDRVWWDSFWWRVTGEKSWAENGFRRYVAVREAKGEEGL